MAKKKTLSPWVLVLIFNLPLYILILNMKNIAYYLLLATATLFTSCDDNTIVVADDYSAILANVGNEVIIRTYSDLATATTALKVATQTLETTPNQANLVAARTAWINARSFWEESEGFLFGPVDQEGIDPSLDSWPVNVTDLNNVLSSSNTLTETFLEQQEGTLKGFHTIEFLLWGANTNKQVADFTAREYEYLAACAALLETDATRLYNLWQPASGNFINNILTAGSGSQLYISEKAALEEIVGALAIIADDVANGKINDPLAAQDLTLEESRFSANSKTDFANNIRSVKNIYTGRYGSFGNSNSISALINVKNAALNADILTKIDAAISSIENITGTFSHAVINASSEVVAAQQAVRELQQILESQLIPLVSAL